MNYDELSVKINEVLGIIDEWIVDERMQYIQNNMEEIEKQAAKLELTCDYFIAEFI
jgi:hypothetical protein